MRKRLSWACVLAVLGAVALSADTSQTYGPLVNSALFQMRVTFIIAQEAPVILTEAATGTYTAACHTIRANLAAGVARNPAGYAPVFASHLVTNINVTSAGTPIGSGSTLDTPATDAALLAAVASQWSTVAGCITNP
jgi:hypothetical protein